MGGRDERSRKPAGKTPGPMLIVFEPLQQQQPLMARRLLLRDGRKDPVPPPPWAQFIVATSCAQMGLGTAPDLSLPVPRLLKHRSIRPPHDELKQRLVAPSVSRGASVLSQPCNFTTMTRSYAVRVRDTACAARELLLSVDVTQTWSYVLVASRASPSGR